MWIKKKTRLRDAGDAADDPRRPQCHPPTSLGVAATQWVDDSEVSVNADDYQHQRRQIETERAPEHKETTRHVTRHPHDCRMPRDLDWDHDERDDQVGDSQVHHVEVDTRPSPATTEQHYEHYEVAYSSHDEHQTVGDYREDAVVAKRQLTRQTPRYITRQIYSHNRRGHVHNVRDVHCHQSFICVYKSWELHEALSDSVDHSAVRRLSTAVNQPSGVTLVGSEPTLSFAPTFIFASVSSHVNVSSAIPVIATPVHAKQRIIMRTFADIIMRGGVNV